MSVEDPSVDFQQLKDVIDLNLIWQNGFFENLNKLVSKSRHSLINSKNYQQIQLEQEEVQRISYKLKLKKQNVIRCFELACLAKLDPKDTNAQSKFNHDIKRKFYYQMNKDLLYPYFAISLHSYFPHESSHAERKGRNLDKPKFTCCDSQH